MKIIKINQNPITNIRSIGSFVKVVDDDYQLQVNESIVVSVPYIEELHRQNIIDYIKKRDVYRYLGIDFDNRTDELKMKIVQNHSINEMKIFTYYLSIGNTQEQAINLIYKTKADQILQTAKCCTSYCTSSKFYLVILTYFPIDEAEKFVKNTFELFNLYKTIALYGKKYGDSSNGIMDYIESYDIYENNGLMNYELNQGMQLSNLIIDLKNILIDGNIDVI